MIGSIANINGIQLYYEVYGEGKPLVLLHGFCGSGATWGKISQELAKKFKVIIPDMRGHGRSTNVQSHHYTFNQVALDIYALLDHLKITKFICMGVSGGGNALLHMATQQPDRVENMVLVSATSYFPEQACKIMAKHSVNSLTDEQWQAMRKLHFHGDEQIREFVRHANAFAIDKTDMNFNTQDLSLITARTMIIQGDRDFLYPLDISIEMFHAIPKSALWIVPEAGHGPLMEENPDYFIERTTKFLEA